MIKKDMVIAVLVAFCLTATLFMIIPTNSASTRPYDAWLDYNDDGQIGPYDLAQLIAHYGSEGTPINKTELLLELQSKIDYLNATIIEQQNIINNLNNTVTYLNSTVVYLNETVIILNSTRGLGTPDYDSGWVTLPYWGAVTITHNLGTKEIIVYLYGKYPNSETLTVRAFGGDGGYTNDGRKYGTWWDCADVNSITVMNDNWGSGGEYWFGQARVLIWKIP